MGLFYHAPGTDPNNILPPSAGWFTQNQPPQGGSAGGANTSNAPSYVNLSDPVQAFVWQGFQQKGVTPRDQGDFQYWVDAVNKTGGITDAGNKGYWTNRFQQAQGGIGDYGTGSGGSVGGLMGGSSGGGPFTAPSLEDAQNSPGYQFALQQGLQGIQRSAAARGTLLTGGTLKALQQYGTGLADQTYGNVFNRALQTNTTNFGHLYDLSKLGVDASQGAAS